MSIPYIAFKKLLYTIALGIALFSCVVSVSFAQDSNSSPQERIAQLLSQLEHLQEQFAQQSNVQISAQEYVWTRNLKMGDRGADVKKLQQFLNSDSSTRVSVFGDGSIGSETEYFGPATARAVKRFQEKYREEVLAPNDLYEGSGYFGISSRQKIKDLLEKESIVITFAVEELSPGRVCITHSAPQCSANESLSSAGVDDDGCVLQLSCVPNADTSVDEDVQQSVSKKLSTSPLRPVEVSSVPTCNAQQMKKMLAPATAEADAYRPKCNPTLTSTDVITKRIFLEKENASGVIFDCKGATLDGSAGTFNYGKDMILVRSGWVNGQWSRPTDVTIKNCTVKGGIRVKGMTTVSGVNKINESSKSLGHTERQQAAAPTRLTIKNLTIVAQNRIALYLYPGVTYTTVRNVKFAGVSNSTSVYLDAESAYNTFENNKFTINPRSSREVFAIDGSAHNVIKNNKFSGLNKGGIFLYRNCGERGTVRHQKPQYNEITGNEFYYNKYKGGLPAIWLGSRTGRARSYCSDDAGYPFGSSIDNGSFAENNIVTGNKIVKLSADKMIRNSNPPNTIAGNGTIKKRGDSLVVDVPVVDKIMCPLYQKPLCQEGEYVVSGVVGVNGCAAAPQCVTVDQQTTTLKVNSAPAGDTVDTLPENVVSDDVDISVGAQVVSTSPHTTKNRLTVLFSGLKGQSSGVKGTVLSGPGNYGGNIWWEVEYENGVSAWSRADRIAVVEGDVLGASISVDMYVQLQNALETLTVMLDELNK